MTKPRVSVLAHHDPWPVSVEARDTVVTVLEQAATAHRETAASLVAAGLDGAGVLFEMAEQLDQQADSWRQVDVTG